MLQQSSIEETVKRKENQISTTTNQRKNEKTKKYGVQRPTIDTCEIPLTLMSNTWKINLTRG